MHGEQNEPAVGGAAGLDAPPLTQDADVDAVLASLRGIANLPPSAQEALLDDAHQRLQDRLAGSSGEAVQPGGGIR